MLTRKLWNLDEQERWHLEVPSKTRWLLWKPILCTRQWRVRNQAVVHTTCWISSGNWESITLSSRVAKQSEPKETLLYFMDTVQPKMVTMLFSFHKAGGIAKGWPYCGKAHATRHITETHQQPLRSTDGCLNLVSYFMHLRTQKATMQFGIRLQLCKIRV